MIYSTLRSASVGRTISESEFQTELNLTRPSRGASSTKTTVGQSVINAAPRLAEVMSSEVYEVEGVEHLSPELQTKALLHPPVLGQREIDVLDAGCSDVTTFHIAERARGRCRERRPVDEQGAIAGVVDVNLSVRNNIGTLRGRVAQTSSICSQNDVHGRATIVRGNGVKLPVTENVAKQGAAFLK